LKKDKLTIGGTDTMTLVVYHATPGSRDAELLALLGSLIASSEEVPKRNNQPTDWQRSDQPTD
jgi:hypothetical protein